MNRAQDRQLAIGRRQKSAGQRQLRSHHTRRDAFRFDRFGRLRNQNRRRFLVQIAGRMMVRGVRDLRLASGRRLKGVCLLLIGVFVVDLR